MRSNLVIFSSDHYYFIFSNSRLRNHMLTARQPLLDGEYYTIAPDNWGANVPHQTTVGFPSLVEGIVSDVEFVLNASNS